jgi:hypothetical protein
MPDPILKASASKLKRSGSQVINECSSFSLEEIDSDIFSSKIRRRDQKKMEKRQYVSVNGDARNMFQPCDFHYL